MLLANDLDFCRHSCEHEVTYAWKRHVQLYSRFDEQPVIHLQLPNANAIHNVVNVLVQVVLVIGSNRLDH